MFLTPIGPGVLNRVCVWHFRHSDFRHFHCRHFDISTFWLRHCDCRDFHCRHFDSAPRVWRCTLKVCRFSTNFYFFVCAIFANVECRMWDLTWRTSRGYQSKKFIWSLFADCIAHKSWTNLLSVSTFYSKYERITITGSFACSQWMNIKSMFVNKAGFSSVCCCRAIVF